MNNNQLHISTPYKATIGRRKWVKSAAYAGWVAILALLPVFTSSPYTLRIFILAFLNVIAAVSFRTITLSGQYSLAHGAFMGIGAYAASMASKWLGWPFWITIPMGALAAMIIGILIGYPFCRLRTLYYGMGTLFFGLGITVLIESGGVWTGGYMGLAGISPIFTTRVPYYYLFLGLTLVSLIALYRLEACRIGMNLKAIASSHLVASSVGINEGWYRIMVVGVGCFFVGLAGACYAHFNTVLAPSNFDLGVTLWIFMYALIGGINSFVGPIIGTFVLFLAPEYFRFLKMYSPYVGAVLLLIVVYLTPEGIVGLPKLIRSWFKERRKGKSVTHAS